MVDWLYVARSAVWIVGASLLLATLSYAAWRAAVWGMSTRAVLIRGPFAAACAAALTLLCLGLAAGASRPWERGLWLALALAFGWASVAGSRGA